MVVYEKCKHCRVGEINFIAGIGSYQPVGSSIKYQCSEDIIIKNGCPPNCEYKPK